MTRRSDWITVSRSGLPFRPFDPRPEHIALEDIACGLSRAARWSGQTVVAYTVAQHSVEVSERLSLPGVAAWGLLHDAAEAYLGDCPRPLKERLFVQLERGGGAFEMLVGVEMRILEAVAERFHLAWPIPKSVWEVDDRYLATERRDLFGLDPPATALEYEPYPERIIPQAGPIAHRLFLARAKELWIE